MPRNVCLLSVDKTMFSLEFSIRIARIKDFKATYIRRAFLLLNSKYVTGSRRKRIKFNKCSLVRLVKMKIILFLSNYSRRIE